MDKPVFYSNKANDIYSSKGPRDAAVLTFSGDSNDSIVKELTQNSLDARIDRNGALEINIRHLKISKTQIPNFSQFEKNLDLMERHWNSKTDQYKRFFETAKKSIEGHDVNLFVFEDFLTKGLEGNDMSGTFKNCVNDENVSGKSHSDSLGNHGIGKNSVFGYSGVQTVFYSSLNDNGDHKFKGVSKMGTYLDEKQIQRSERMYYGLKIESGIKLISDPNIIPKVFKRSETGLSQFVLGAELQENWSDNIRRAFLENYWLLFENEKLTVKIDEKILDHHNYETEAERLFKGNSSKENPIPFIIAYKDKQVCEEREIHKIGKVIIYLKEAGENDNFPNRVVFLRDGMKIKLDNLGVGGIPTNIAGVMFCVNAKGNSILGAMEPHAHDRFLPELVAKKKVKNITVDDARQILGEIAKFRKDIISQIKEKYTQETENVDVVDDLFSKLLGLGMGSGAGKTTDSKEESFHKRIVRLDFDTWFSSNQRNSSTNLIEETDLGEGKGQGAGTGQEGKGVRGGKGKTKGRSGGSADQPNKTKGKIKHDITSRFFISDSSQNHNYYNLIIRSENDIPSMDIIIGQKGDSDRTSQMSADLLSAESNGKMLNFEKIINKDNEVVSFKINGIEVKESIPGVVRFTLNEKKKSALKIIETI